MCAEHLSNVIITIITIIFFTLGINDPEGFWKKLSKIRNVGVTITPGSPRG